MQKMLFLFTIAILFGCKKDSRPVSLVIKPAAIAGKWVRGKFDVKQFWTYKGESVQHSSLTTDAMSIAADGTVELFTVSFPVEPEITCKPQRFTYRKGTAAIDSSLNKITVGFTEGNYREFYQNCATRMNVNRPLTPQEVAQAPLVFFYELRTVNGARYFYLSYSSSGQPALILEETSW